MSLASNGITPDVIREMMPPYHLSPDLLEATFAALPPPPPAASPPWRQARLARLLQEIATLMPANAAQARLVAQILIVRELADTIAARAYAPELTVPQMCRVGRASAELVRTATGLLRALAREQQKPAAFFGTVLADAVDVAALEAGWGKGVAEAAARGPDGAAEAAAEPATDQRQGAAEPETGEADRLGAAGARTAATAVAAMAGTSARPGEGARRQAPGGQGLPAAKRQEIVAINPMHLSARPAAAANRRSAGALGETPPEAIPVPCGVAGPFRPEAGGGRENPAAARS